MVVYVAPSQTIAERVVDGLEQGGILARMRPVGSRQGEIRQYEILVPEAELDEACQLLGRSLTGR